VEDTRRKFIDKDFAEQIARSAQRSYASNFGRSDQVALR
jgi:hypothetical protein